MKVYVFLALLAFALGKEEKCFAPMICNSVPTWARISMAGEDGTCVNQMNKFEGKADNLDRSINKMSERLEYLKTLISSTMPVTVDNTKTTDAENSDDAKLATQAPDATTSESVATHGIEASDKKSTAGLTTRATTTAYPAPNTTTSEPVTTQEIETFSEESTAGLTTSVATTADPDSLWYNGKRYVALTSDWVNQAGAISKCQNISGQLANVYSQKHMNVIMDYVRQNKLNGELSGEFYLGMIYDPINKILRLRDGTRVLISDYKWFPDRPADGADQPTASYTNMFISINRDPLAGNQYLYNYPDIKRQVLCEI